jgi:hypothetical protein
MTKILVISDTHSFLDEKIFKYINAVDEVWHAGDIGDIKVCDKIKALKPLRAVHGNIDDATLRKAYLETEIFYCEKVKVCLRHIAGPALKYNAETKAILEKERPKVLVCGHSHILKVQYDTKYSVLYMNPGAAGKHGFHKLQTLLRFSIDEEKIENLEVIELGTRQ